MAGVARRALAILSVLAALGGGSLVAIVLTATPAHALTFSADILTDENDPTCVPGDCSLREAINAAAANPGPDTVSLDAVGTYQLDALLGPLPTSPPVSKH